MPLLQTFDALVCDDSRPLRASSVTPLQALAMYNGDFVNEEAKCFADRIRREAGSSADRQIERGFLLALGRRPTPAEAERMKSLLVSGSSAQDPLAGFCRILFNVNEFIYID
jgi:hypothetical protein